MAGHAHDRAGAVSHQHIIRDPDWDLLVVDRVDRVGADENPGLFLGEISPFEIGFGGDLFPIRSDFRTPILGRQPIDERMLGGEHHVIRSVDCVVSRGENADALVDPGNREFDFRAFAPPDPVSLEKLDSCGPIEVFQFIGEPLGERRDSQHPLPHGPAHDWEAAHLAFAVNDFFVGQDGSQIRAPIHRHFGDVGEADAVGIIAAIGRDRFGPLRVRVKP